MGPNWGGVGSTYWFFTYLQVRAVFGKEGNLTDLATLTFTLDIPEEKGLDRVGRRGWSYHHSNG